MSNLSSALNGASASGFAKVEELGLRGMITLRGDLASTEVAAAVKAATGADVPDVRKIVSGDKGQVAWMSPDELLVLVAYEDAVATVEVMTKELGSSHSLVVNVSDARAMFRVSGEAAADVLAKVAPVDLSNDAFAAGDFRRTRLAQVAAAFWKTEDGAFELICFRSVGQYVFDLLRVCAESGGEVRFFQSQ